MVCDTSAAATRATQFRSCRPIAQKQTSRVLERDPLPRFRLFQIMGFAMPPAKHIVLFMVCCYFVQLVCGDYIPPVPRDDDPEIISRDVKCQGKLDASLCYLLSFCIAHPLSFANPQSAGRQSSK